MWYLVNGYEAHRKWKKFINVVLTSYTTKKIAKEHTKKGFSKNTYFKIGKVMFLIWIVTLSTQGDQILYENHRICLKLQR